MFTPDPNRRSRFSDPKYDPHELEQMKRQNNPEDRPTGPFTGRCQCCGSNDLWDDNLAYGCNTCGVLLGTN